MEPIKYSEFAKEQELTNAGAYLRNMAENYVNIKRIMNRRDATIPLYKEYGELGPAIVTASGPSLTEATPCLNELRHTLGAKIFAGASQVWGLVDAGVRPDYVMTNDMWPGTSRYLPQTNDRKKIAKKILPIAHPGVWREFLRWPGMRDQGLLFFIRPVPEKETEDGELSEMEKEVLMGLPRRHLGTIVAVVTAILYANNPEVKYPIGAQLFLAPDSTVQAAMIATTMGHDPVYLLGYDQCFWKGRSRARTVEGSGKIYDGDRYDGIAKTTASGFRASNTMLYYRTMALVFQARINMRMIEVVVDGTPGNLQYLPRAPLDELLKGNQPNPSREDILMNLKLGFKKSKIS